MAKKENLNTQTNQLKTYTDQRMDELAGMVQREFEEVYKRLDVRGQ